MQNKKSSFTVLVCVKDALKKVVQCFESIVKYTQEDFELIVIDDNSKKSTKEFLESCAKQFNTIKLIKNTVTLGYTKSLNIGLRQVNTNFVIVLNSDVIVTQNWTKKLLAPMFKHDDVGIVSPLSNAALWQSIPDIFDKHGNYNIHVIPGGFKINSFGIEIENQFSEQFTEVSIVNGFCMVIRSSLLNEVGLFDYINFPVGYGEETDFCIRTLKMGYRIIVKLDTYIYHYKSCSFGYKQRNRLITEGNITLSRLYGANNIERLYVLMKNNIEINRVRKIVGLKYYATEIPCCN